MADLRAIIVDDEEGARDVLQNLLIRFCEGVDVIAKCNDIVSAIVQINILKPDVVFLDIEMPNYAGFEIVNFIKDIDFEIVFVTAYDQYAIKAFEVSAIDYLLKPVDIERLRNAVTKVKQQRNLQKQLDRLSILSSTLETKKVKNVIVTDKGQQHIIALENLIAIEAQESYCILHTTDKNLIASKNLKHFETILESLPNFFRVHKSWIINKDHLKQYSKTELSVVLSNGLVTKLSKYKKAEFEATLA